MWNGPSLWERRARNKKSMILKEQNNPKVTRENKASKVSKSIPQARGA
jgi:hypothetical protein